MRRMNSRLRGNDGKLCKGLQREREFERRKAPNPALSFWERAPRSGG